MNIDPTIDAGHPAKILVVDDDKNNRKYYLQVLRKNGYQVDEAASGEEAIEYIGRNDYEIVLSDLQMHTVSGLDVLQAAKEKDAHTQVVIMTGYGSIPTAVKAIQQGAFDFMSKPINKDAFQMRIQKALERRQMHLCLEAQQRRLTAYNLMIARDLELAEKVQASLVPTNFENDRIAVGIEYHPMIGIGGDFCNIYQNDDHVNLNVVDVTGHGIAAALLVNRIYNEINAILKTAPEPKYILTAINSFLYDTFGTMGLFLTMMSILLDFKSRKIRYAGGGHPAALLYHPEEKSIKMLASQNTIIGFTQNRLFTQDSQPLVAGDRILICTDGILEAEDKDKNQFGRDGLLASMTTHIHKGVTQACQSIIHDVLSFSGEHNRDDMMLIIVEIR
ncbi:SpoIIE family protein phosphatase [candidate division KSB1 bacterium]|nr:SpoIIE family protein phosphatase [candidate division KSB1 bacterium]RQW06583.1 MAG: response regulator [candidate division KSB1 bacterium]